MATLTASLDLQTAIVDKAGNATRYLAQFIRGLTDRIQSTPFAATGQIVSVSAQTALIAASALVASTSSPLYRISFDLRISTPGGISSAAQVTIGWTEGSVAQTHVGANVNGNTTTSKDSDVFLIRPDAGTVVTYAVSYASAGAPVMAFTADFSAEALG